MSDNTNTSNTPGKTPTTVPATPAKATAAPAPKYRYKGPSQGMLPGGMITVGSGPAKGLKLRPLRMSDADISKLEKRDPALVKRYWDKVG